MRDGIFQRSLFDQQNLAEITDVPEFPGSASSSTRTPLAGAQRARKRQEPMDATEAELELIKARVDKQTLLASAQIRMKAAWKPTLFTDEHRPTSKDPVAKAVRSPAAQALH